ncbi:MAG: CPBP family intramembrane metalloprotease [Proteobacteria bacterium]|nr:CPBP family intramembrane metalloprotease [Pseudomonadota bacterium]
MNVSIYLKNSSHRFYGAVVALIMLVLYEIFVIWEPSSGGVMRNAPEVWLRTALNFMGISHYHISFVMITVALLAIPVFYRTNVVINKRIFFLVMVESVLWGAISGILIQTLIAGLFFMTGTISGSLIGDIGLAIGAGLFEELLFRVILTTALIWIGSKILPARWVAVLCAIILASFLFSLAHYIGNAADPFEVYSFLFRFFAGLWFTTLFSLRGFAVVCMTHAFYDIFIILL